MNKFIKFYHLHLPSGGVITGAAVRETEDSKEFRVGLAFCSPNDRFSKKIARAISVGRAGKRPYIVHKRNSVEAIKEIIRTVATSRENGWVGGPSHVPQWLPGFSYLNSYIQ